MSTVAGATSNKNKKRKVPVAAVIKDEEGEEIKVGADGCEVRSDDEDDDGSDLQDFVVDEEEVVKAPVEEKSTLVDLDQSNIVCGKRKRKPVTRYVDTEEYKKQYLKVAIKHEEPETETEEEGLEDDQEQEEETGKPEAELDEVDEDEEEEEDDDYVLSETSDEEEEDDEPYESDCSTESDGDEDEVEDEDE